MTTFKTDTEPVSTKYEHDNLNRLKTIIENFQPGVAKDVETNVTTTYTYDADGNRLSIRDGQSHLEEIDYRTHFTYDAFERLETETDPLGFPTSYRYDAMGNRTRQTDALGQRTCLYYDELNRLIGKHYRSDDNCPAPDPANYAVTFAYNALGRRQSMGDDLGTTGWEYNNLGLPKQITDPFGTNVLYDYDALGNRTNLSHGEQAYAYKYDAVNRLYEVTGSGLSNKVAYGYEASGRLKTITHQRREYSLIITTMVGCKISLILQKSQRWHLPISILTIMAIANRQSKISSSHLCPLRPPTSTQAQALTQPSRQLCLVLQQGLLRRRLLRKHRRKLKHPHLLPLQKRPLAGCYNQSSSRMCRFPFLSHLRASVRSVFQ
jgi:YD repeat-containing protein